MYTRITFLLSSLFLFACGSLQKPNHTATEDSAVLTYTLSPKLQQEQATIKVDFVSKTDENGRIVFCYPNTDWGQTDLFDCLIKLETKPEAKIDYLKDSNQIVLHGKAKTTYQLSYQIVQDYIGRPQAKNTYRPIVNNSYFHVFGKNLLVLPAAYFGDDGEKRKVQLNWETADEDFKLINSFGNQKKQTFEVTYSEIYTSIFAGGELEIDARENENERIVLATTDRWNQLDIKKAADDLNTIITQQRDFWNDHSEPLKTVLLVKTDENCPSEHDCSYSLGGTALTHSFAAFSSDNFMTSNEQLAWLFAHELFHQWVGQTIQNESEEKEYWFSEGFTDYYAYKTLLKNGMLTPYAFVERVNANIIKPHYSSTINNRPNSEITHERFWSDQAWEKLPYQRGFLYAFYLDIQIKNGQKGSLDDVMRAILSYTQKNKLAFNEDVFLSILDPFVPNDFRETFQTHITDGVPLDFSKVKCPVLYFEDDKIPQIVISGSVGEDELGDFLKQ